MIRDISDPKKRQDGEGKNWVEGGSLKGKGWKKNDVSKGKTEPGETGPPQIREKNI